MLSGLTERVTSLMPSTITKDVFPFTAELVRFETERRRKHLMHGVRSPDCRAELELAAAFLSELEAAQATALATNNIDLQPALLTHTIVEKLSNVLDKIYFEVWQKRLAPAATWKSPSERARAEKHVYFPIYEPGQRRGAVGGPVCDVLDTMPALCGVLDDAQPTASKRWLALLKHIARQKHMRIIPHERKEARFSIYPGLQHVPVKEVIIQRLRVLHLPKTNGLRFEIVGYALDPEGQELPLHPDTMQIELWDTLMIEDLDVDAFAFCTQALEQVTAVVAALQPFTEAPP